MSKFSEKKLSSDKQKKIVQDVKDHIGSWRSYYAENLEHFKNMTAFVNGEQWTEDERTAYKKKGKVRLVINKIRPYLKQISGEDNEFTTAIKLRNVGSTNTDSSEQINQMKDADVLRGLIRNIAYHSQSTKTYNAAYDHAKEGGFGAWRVIVSQNKNHNVLRIQRINDPANCYWDIGATEDEKTDGDYCGVVSYLSKASFERKYPKLTYPEGSEFTAVDEYKVEWGNEKRIAVIEEYRRENYKEKIYIFEDGRELSEAEIEKEPALEKQAKEVKKITKNRIAHYKICDHELLEKSETPFDELPILFVGGYVKMINGKEVTYSYADDAKDPQRKLNFVASEMAEWLKITKKVKFLAPYLQVAKFTKYWNDADNPAPYLPYDSTAAPGDRPTPINPPPMPQDLVQQYQQAELDIRMAMGRYEPNVGAQSQGASGRAIFNLSLQGNTSVADYRKARNNAIAVTGRIILNAIPYVYDDTRYITITGNNDIDKTIGINQSQYNSGQGSHAIAQTFAPNSYSIEVDVGASFPMQKAENARVALELVRADQSGRAYNLLSPIIAENLEASKSALMASRLNTLVPPEIIMQENNPVPEEERTQQQMQAAQQQQQQQQQVEQLKMQNAQLLNQELQIKNMASQQKMTNDHIKVIADAMEAMRGGQASLMNAETNAKESQQQQAIQNSKAEAEITKAKLEVMKSEAELHKQMLSSEEVM